MKRSLNFLLLLLMVATTFTSCKKSEPAPAAPVADFTFTPATGVAPLVVTFTNTSLNATSYLWDFGGGVTSTETNPVRTAVGVGSLTVTLTATGPGGVNKITKNVVVRDQTPQEKIIGKYKITAANVVSTSGVTTNVLAACRLDDIIEFNTNNQSISDNGTSRCSATEPAIEINSYNLNPLGTTISIGTDNYDVINLSRTVLQLRITLTGGVGNITFTKI